MPHPIPAPSHRNNTFYSSMAVLFAISVFVGFSRTYYLRTLFGGPHLPSLTHIHGAVFTLWTLFFLFQALLVSSGRIGAHRRLGWMGAVFAVGIVILGTAMTFHSMQAAQASGGPVMGLRLINGVIDLLLFCGFFGFALLLRRRREIHKRLMMLAMISLIIPAGDDKPDHPCFGAVSRTLELDPMGYLRVLVDRRCL